MNNFFVIANADKDTDFELTRTVCDFLTQKVLYVHIRKKTTLLNITMQILPMFLLKRIV